MYSVTVKIDGIESRRRSAGLLHVVNGFFLVAKAVDLYRMEAFRNFLPALPVLLIATPSLFYGFFRRRTDPFAKYNYILRLLQIIAFTYLGFMFLDSGGGSIHYIGVFIFALITILLLFSERRIFQETTIFFDEDGIRIPGYYRDHKVNWSELEDVSVREDFITLFHIRQKYLQYQVMQDLSTLEVAKLNAFCKDMIKEKQLADGNPD
jgi:hypothetical protein